MIKAYTSKYLAPLVVGTAMTVSSFSGLELTAQDTPNVQQDKQKRDMSRYRKHEGTWWYEIEYDQWVYWDGDEWKKPKYHAPFPPKPPKGFEKNSSLSKSYQEITPEKRIYIRKISELELKLYNQDLSRDEYEIEKKKLFEEYNIGPEEQHLSKINNEVIVPLTLGILKLIFSNSSN